MVAVGYTLLCEQTGPRQLVDYAVRAEDAGFDQLVISDHYYPWLESQGHSPYAWSVLGAVAHVTSRADLMSFVTCPIRRYHPAVVAQKAATIGVLSEGRFTLGLGAGENLNEHVVGAWPHVQQRHEMFEEALQIIRPLLAGQTAHLLRQPLRRTRRLPVGPPGAPGADRRRRLRAVLLSARRRVRRWDDRGRTGSAHPRSSSIGPAGSASPATGRCRSATGRTRPNAAGSCFDQWRWFGLGWKVNAELPGPESFASAAQFVRPEDVAGTVPCGPDVASARGGVPTVRRRRLHPCRAGAGRRGEPADVPGLGPRGTAAPAA